VGHHVASADEDVELERADVQAPLEVQPREVDAVHDHEHVVVEGVDLRVAVVLQRVLDRQRVEVKHLAQHPRLLLGR
jgi:hypothetical protein